MTTPKRRQIALLAALAGVLAVALVIVMAPRWAGRGRAPAPPVIAEVPEFSLTHLDGRQVGRRDLAGRPWLADLIFTRCTLSCPQMTTRMRSLGEPLAAAGGARRVSITVDPAHDTPAVLAAYAAAHGVTDSDWLFLTGAAEQVRALVTGGLLLGYDVTPPPGSAEQVLHSTRFVLVDGDSRIRGFYDAFNATDVDRLLADLAALHREARDAGIR